MIIHDFYVVSISFHPLEAYAPPIVYTNTVLIFAISLEFFQMICGWDAQIIERYRAIEHPKFT